MEDIYTGRVIGIFTDAHGLLEPTIAILLDMKKRGIKEMYSLGDNIGVGPNPKEVIDLLDYYGVKSVSGNSEYYSTLGIEPFNSYFSNLKTQSQLWTLSKLGERELGIIRLFPSSIELFLGNKKIALCHFANDVRFDYFDNSTWSYQDNMRKYNQGYKQFLYTNSDAQMENIKKLLEETKDDESSLGLKDAKRDPLFGGKQVTYFDALFQGHVHFKLYEKSGKTEFYTIRAAGFGYENDPIDSASYVILREKKLGGFDFEEVLVPYDRERMEYSILHSDMPDRRIERFTEIKR